MIVPDNLIFLQVVPKDLYFMWQIEVQITSFRKFGISDRMEILVWYPRGYDISAWVPIVNKYPEVKFFFYMDEGVNLGLYIPQLRPHTLKKHFKVHADRLKEKKFFYHDADIIFNFLPDFNLLCEDNVVWQSDCSHYLDYNYMLRKEKQGNIPDNEAIKKFAEIGHIPVEIIEAYANNTGGAQVLLKEKIDYDFWQDVEDQCVKIRQSFMHGKPGSINTKYFSSEAEGFQSWCADMWALNFALWNRGISTSVTKDLAFSWASDSIDVYKERPIFHNAGATKDSKDIFYKGGWVNQSPLGVDLPPVNENSASKMYVQAIKDVKIT